MSLNQNKSLFHGKRYVFLSIVVALSAAFALNVFIQYRIEMLPFIWTSPVLFLYTSLMLFCTISFCSALTGNVFIGSVVMYALFILVTFADRNKFAVRGEHIFPEDLFVSGNLGAFTGMYDSFAFVRQIILIVIIAMAAAALTYLLIRARRRNGVYKKSIWSGEKFAKWLSTRLIIAALSAVLLVAMAFPLTERNNPFAGWLGFDNLSWSQNLNYVRNGFVAAFISNMSRAKLEKPPGYSEEAIRGIFQKYKERADEANIERINLKDEYVDIVFILNESFTDPSRIKDVFPVTGEDVTPNLHILEQKVPSGTLRTSQFGGGTANVEFEALTGFPLYFVDESVSAFQELLAGRKSFPSLAHFLNETGSFDAIGMHPYDSAMYKRNTIYPKLGFDSFLFENDFSYRDPYETAFYISDASAYREMFDILDSSDNNNNAFVFLITMQNHGSYGDQLQSHPFISETEPPETYKPAAIDDYLALLNASDAALGDLAKKVFERDKKTMVLFFGDHLPGVYNDLLDKGDDRRYETPLLILANFGDPEFEIEMISPNFIPMIVIDYMYIKKSPFFFLLEAVKAETPVLTHNYFIAGEAPEKSGALSDYYMIMYDTVSGNGYAERMGFFSLD